MAVRRKDLTAHERGVLLQFLLQNHQAGRLVGGKVAEAMVLYNVSRATVKRTWQAAKKAQQAGESMVVPSGKTTRIQPKRKGFDKQKFANLPLKSRSSYREISKHMQLSKSQIGRLYKSKQIKAHTNSIKPHLTDRNKLHRLQFCLEAIKFDSLLNGFKFKSMYNTVHIDEKWFYLTRIKHRFYLIPEEADPHRTIKNKNFVPKVMFMCAVARPIISEDGTVLFDGKIGIFPFTHQVAALRGSKRRPKGTLETKPVDSVTKEVIRDCLINQILPAIKAKWPEGLSKNIMIQQDNARPHLKDNDPEWRHAATADGFNIQLVQQPPNSPDLNVNDLGWFRSIQTIQHEKNCTNVDELLAAVLDSFQELCPKKLNNVFLSLQNCMVEILKIKGHNSYKGPHMKKEALAREGTLPIDLEVPENLVMESLQHLLEAGIVDGMESLMDQLGIKPL